VEQVDGKPSALVDEEQAVVTVRFGPPIR